MESLDTKKLSDIKIEHYGLSPRRTSRLQPLSEEVSEHTHRRLEAKERQFFECSDTTAYRKTSVDVYKPRRWSYQYDSKTDFLSARSSNPNRRISDMTDSRSRLMIAHRRNNDPKKDKMKETNDVTNRPSAELLTEFDQYFAYNEFGEKIRSHESHNPESSKDGSIKFPQIINESDGSLDTPAVILETVHLPAISTEPREKEVAVEPEQQMFSPVPTPLGWNEGGTAGLDIPENIDDDILLGNLTASSKPRSHTLKVFVHSVGSDSEVERSTLIQNVFPELKGYARQRGYDVEFLDLHWGVKDSTNNEQVEREILLECIRRGVDQGGDQQLFCFMSFVGQKYGPRMLPVEMSQKDFDLVRSSIQRKLDRLNRLVETIQTTGSGSTTVPSSGSKKNGTSAQRGGGQDAKLKLSASDKRQSSKTQVRGGSVGLDFNPTKEIMRASDQLEMVSTWYFMDSNSEPPIYHLQKPSAFYPDLTHRNVAQRTQALHSWFGAHQKLMKIFERYLLKGSRDSEGKRFHISLSELEINEYISASKPAGISVPMLWLRREFEDIQDGYGDLVAKDYVDILPLQTILDKEFTMALEHFTNKLEELIPEEHQRCYRVCWSKTGIDPSNQRSHRIYLNQLSLDVKTFVEGILDELRGRDVQFMSAPKSFVLDEVRHHVQECRMRAAAFCGRKREISEVKRYVQFGNPRPKVRQENGPLVIHGRQGCGRTSLMAKVAVDSSKWMTATSRLGRLGCSVIVRFIGSTPNSRNIVSFLGTLCQQLCHILETSFNSIHRDFNGLLNTFYDLLRITASDTSRTIVIFVDSLEKLNSQAGKLNLAWLPRQLPDNVRIVVSVSSDDACLLTLKERLKETSSVWLEVGDLLNSDASLVIENHLARVGRHLTAQQRQLVDESLAKCQNVLNLVQILKEAIQWPSYVPPDDVKLGLTVKSMTALVLERLEKEHCEPLVRRALGFLTASRDGLTQNELEDLLSIDDTVMDEVQNFHKPPLIHFPVMLLLRICHDLGSYLEEYPVDGCQTIRWSHSSFHEAARERYLKHQNSAVHCHKVLSDYFRNIFHNTAEQTGRCIMTQSLDLNLGPQTGSKYNLRRLRELPFHLLRSQQLEQLKEHCLCNLDFFSAKIGSNASVDPVLEDIQMALAYDSTDADLLLLLDVIRASSDVIERNPGELGSQLVGRLQSIIENDKPNPGTSDPPKYLFIAQLLRSVRDSCVPVLFPSTTCCLPPEGLVSDFLSSHRAPITAISTSHDGLTALTSSKDNTMKLWELETGIVKWTILGVGESVREIHYSPNDALAFTAESKLIRIWNLAPPGECLKRIDEYEDPATICVVESPRLLVAFFQGCACFRTWDIFSQGIPLLKEFTIDDSSLSKYVTRTAVTSSQSVGSVVLHAFRNSEIVSLVDVVEGKILRRFQVREGRSIVALAVTRGYFICVVRCRKPFVQFTIQFFDGETCSFLRDLQGCVGESISGIQSNSIGSHLIAFGSNSTSGVTHVGLWNVETGRHVHLAKQIGRKLIGSACHLTHVLTSSDDQRSVRVWNLKERANLAVVTKEKPPESVAQIWAINGDPRKVLVRLSVGNVFQLWDVTKNRYVGAVVEPELKIAGAKDSVLVHGTLAIILGDRWHELINDEEVLVFRSVKVFDLEVGQYRSERNGFKIVQSPVEEYSVLSGGEQLLGPSETRSFFCVWCLTSGAILHRIKTSFREKDLVAADVDYEVPPLTPTPDGHPYVVRTRTGGPEGGAFYSTPWSRRVETKTARTRRHLANAEEERKIAKELAKEKRNPIERFVVSDDQSTIVTSYFGHHMCVFDVNKQKHVHTLENPDSLMLLYASALTGNGRYLAQAHYDDRKKIGCISLWDCEAGSVKARLENVANVCAVAVNDDAGLVIYAAAADQAGRDPDGKNGKMFIWEPRRSSSTREMVRRSGCLEVDERTKMTMMSSGRVVVYSPGSISVWDVGRGEQVATFTPDFQINCLTLAFHRELIVFGLNENPKIVILQLTSRDSGLPALEDDVSPVERSDAEDVGSASGH